MELRGVEEWEERRCNSCLSEDKVKELAVGGMVIALCEKCQAKLLKMLEENQLNH